MCIRDRHRRVTLINQKEGELLKVRQRAIYEAEKGDWQETTNFSKSEVLKLTRLLDRAYDHIAEFLEKDKLEIK